ncbi:uncharacterized protein LOC141691993 [Apium graveolens]|uniref:uncharacterized protein LOC141691993 n=1 Tax=Apium graveolens TaxID=4045 RepID=UPI003D7B0457
MLIGAMNVHRVFLDNGSSTNILYYSTYKKLGFPDSDMYFEDAHVYGFTGEAVRVMGSVRLPVTLGEGALSVTQMIDFKFPTPNGVGSLRESQYESRDCYHKAVKEFHRIRYEGKDLPFEDAEDIHDKPSGEVHAHYFVESPGKEETNVFGNSFLTRGRISRIRSVEEVVVNHIEAIIQKEVNGEKLEGRSEILQGIRQKRRPVSGERAITLKEEVDRLLEVGLIKESFYPEWLVNPVLVKKPNGKWRTCVDFTDLNKACPKDSFPLPRIDQLVDATAGHALLSFMDAYSVSVYSISAVLVREEDGQQSPVYYVSKRLHDTETRYTSMEKLVYAMILASRKLRPYFQAHRVEVRTAYPL